MKALARNNGTRSRQAIFHVAPGGSVPTSEELPADLLRASTPSKLIPIDDENFSVHADTLTTPVTSRFRHWLLFNVIRVVGCLGVTCLKRILARLFYSHRLTLTTERAEIMKTMARNNGTRPRRTIFHVVPGGSVPNLEDLSADLLRVETSSKIQPIFYECYPAIADTPTTPLTSRFRLWLHFNVIHVVGCLWILV